MKIKIKRFDKSLPLPQFDEADPKTGKHYDQSQVAGFDLFCRESVTIEPGKIAMVGINNAIQAPPDCFILVLLRSSTSWKKGLILANGAAIIDPFYSGDSDEVKIQLYNITDKPVQVTKGETLAQGIIIRREPVEWEEVETMGGDGHGGYKTD